MNWNKTMLSLTRREAMLGATAIAGTALVPRVASGLTPTFGTHGSELR